MFPFLVILIGLAVLAFGKRLPVLGAAVGALLGVGLLHLFSVSVSEDTLLVIALPAGLAVAGYFLIGMAQRVVDIVLIVLGTLGGAAVVLGFLDLFDLASDLLGWLLAIAGGAAGYLLVTRFKDMALLVLAGLLGGLLVTRGLTVWFPTLEGALGTLLVLALAGGGIAYQGGFLARRKAAAQAQGTAKGQ